MIGGNIVATVEKKTVKKNKIGESVSSWVDYKTIKGWLDYTSGANDLSKHHAKVQDTTHIFMCDYQTDIKPDYRLKIHNDIYAILQVDNPMEMNKHLEIYLKYIGGGIGV
ncbi:MAG: phage head closure protein [Eubacterium sp.]|nr:phage head closure protein [Eubacterium sp.]